MPKFMLNVSYTTEGVKGVLKEGGTGRSATIGDLVAAHNGTMEAFYFAFGTDDVIVIVDVPDDPTMAAVSLAVGASGAARVHTTALLTPEQIDTATHIAVAYRAPGA